METVSRDIDTAVKRMKYNAMGRDDAIAKVLAVRRGDFASVWPDQFSDRYPTSIIANFVDIAARDLAANLSSLPMLACSAGMMRTDSDKRRAEKKNRIGFNYWKHSRLQTQMKYGADQWLSFGFLPFWVEPDVQNKLPLIHVEDPNGAYYELNRWLECKRYARTWRQDCAELAAQYPEYESVILYDDYGQSYEGTDTEVVRYTDDTWTYLYLPQRKNMILGKYRHRQKDEAGRPQCPVHIALRPGVEQNPRGQFDDVLWVQIAKSVMAALTLEAAHQAVQAPIAAPNDINELPLGPNAFILSDNPDKIRRVSLELPQSAFMLGQQLGDEMKQGAGFPDSRLGIGPSGGSTGRGISALEGGFDTQIKLGQDILGEGEKVITEMAFRLEMEWWPNKAKTISGNLSGESFQLSYTPNKDIGANTSCDVSFGFAAGLSPNSAIVTLLQLRGDSIIGRDTFRRNLPFDLDIDQQQRELDVQAVEDGLKQGLAAALTAADQMIAQGQTPLAMQFFQMAVDVIAGRRAGKDLADTIMESMKKQQDAAEQAQQAAQQPPGGAPGAPGAVGPDGQPLAGVAPNGLPSGVAPGQAGLPPGGRPSIQDLTAGFTGSGAASVGDTVHRRLATG